MEIKEHLSAETTLCGFQLKAGVCRYWIDIGFHRKSDFRKFIRSEDRVVIEHRKVFLDYDLSIERHTSLDGKGLISFARKIDCLKDDLEDIIAIEVSDGCGSEKTFIKVRFDGGVFKRETNYPGSAPVMKLMEETEKNKPVEDYAKSDCSQRVVLRDIENEGKFARIFDYAD